MNSIESEGLGEAPSQWPPKFTLDQEAVLNLLTGDRFYSNPSAALREAVLNAIDAVHRRRGADSTLLSQIYVDFDRDALSLSVSDNGIGMGRSEVTALFTRVGASAAREEVKKSSVGEFGIGVVSYFMAADKFELQTNDGTEAIGLAFDRVMLAGSAAVSIAATRNERGTTVTLFLRDIETFDLLLGKYDYWCRDVDGLVGRLHPGGRALSQGASRRAGDTIELPLPVWIEKAHLAPVADPVGWDAMTGTSVVAVLYRGVFVQEFEIKGLWGIDGSIDVDPKHFKPRLNREGFIAGQFQEEVQQFLRGAHPSILRAMAGRLAAAVVDRQLDKWTEKKWANLWLAVPRQPSYAAAVEEWDRVFRSLPAFEMWNDGRWEPVSVERLARVREDVFIAPLADEKTSDLVKAAVRLLRSGGRPVIRGIRRDPSWLRFAGSSYGTTADLIADVFRSELPVLVPIVHQAEAVLARVVRVAPLFSGPPSIDLVRMGGDGPPALRLADRLVINIEHADGVALVADALRVNGGPSALIGLAAKHAYEQLTQVAAAVRDAGMSDEALSPIRRRYIRRFLS